MPIFLTAEDESRQFIGWFDRVRGDDCSFEVGGDGLVRCLPSNTIEAKLFADATCRRHIALASVCPSPKYVIERESTCVDRPRLHVHEPGRRLHPTAVYAQMDRGCVRVPVDDAGVYVAVGDELPPALFVAARPTAGWTTLQLKTAYVP